MLDLKVESVDVTNNDSIITFVQNERLSMYSNVDDDEVKQELLNQLAKTALDNKKIKVESEGKALDLEYAKTLHSLISGIGKNPFLSEKVVGEIPMVSLPDVEINPGEMEIGLSNLSMEDISGLSPGMQGLHK